MGQMFGVIVEGFIKPPSPSHLKVSPLKDVPSGQGMHSWMLVS
jgi:hypothetical protein